MSGSKPEQHEPEVHVDTTEQAAARQLIETSQRVTHVHIEPETAEATPEEDYSLMVLVKKVPAKNKTAKPAGKG